jgi:hypothetical protein
LIWYEASKEGRSWGKPALLENPGSLVDRPCPHFVNTVHLSPDRDRIETALSMVLYAQNSENYAQTD